MFMMRGSEFSINVRQLSLIKDYNSTRLFGSIIVRE
jgi:hypothetical protein